MEEKDGKGVREGKESFFLYLFLLFLMMELFSSNYFF